MAIKLNPIKQLVLLKSLQIFFLISISIFLIIIFISSLFYATEKIFLLNNQDFNDSLIIGLYHISSYSNNIFNVNLSNYAIAYFSIFGILFAGLIINTGYLWLKYRFDKKQYFEMIFCFVGGVLLILIMLLTFYFTNLNHTLITNSNEWTKFNTIVEYKITMNNTYSIIQSRYTTAGIWYIIIHSYCLLALLFFPAKMLYNLVKVRYIN